MDNIECEQVSAPAWRRMIGILPAESRWWNDDVGSHFGDACKSWLSMLSLEDDTMSWSVSRLSSGERQRLALVRLLCNRPKALLLDEPTASLDPDGVRRTEEVIRSYRTETGSPVLWVSHDPEQIARVSTRHFEIRDGKLVEGTKR